MLEMLRMTLPIYGDSASLRLAFGQPFVRLRVTGEG